MELVAAKKAAGGGRKAPKKGIIVPIEVSPGIGEGAYLRGRKNLWGDEQCGY